MYPYLIKRVRDTTDQTAPWDGVVFVHEVGSDELGEALRTCFPHCKNLRERKYVAIIEFLKHELSEMVTTNAAQPTARTPPMYDLQRMSSDRPEVHIDTKGYVQPQETPSVSHSPSSSNCSSNLQVSSRQRRAAPQAPAILSMLVDPTTATHSSQFVFNAVDGRTMQQKTKRKMTVEERVDYRETRRRGACSKCKRQKGKCTHLRDVDSNPRNLNMIADQFQRKISIGDSHDTKLSNAPRLQDTPNQDGYDSAVRQQTDLYQHQAGYASRRSSNASVQPLSGSGSPQCPDTVSEGSQFDMSGYVHQSHSFEEFPMQNQACWPDYQHDVPHIIDSFRPAPSFDDNQDRNDHSEIPSIYVLGPEQNEHASSEHSFLSPWELGQQPFPENNGYT